MVDAVVDAKLSPAGPWLAVDSLGVRYGGTTALEDVSLSVPRGEVLAVLGANGAGKTSLINAVLGSARACSGSVRFKGSDVTQQRTAARVRSGMAVVPEGRRVFGGLTVAENLKVGGFTKPGELRRRVDDLLQQFPMLAARSRQLAGTLSGGQQQILAIARALAADPTLLLLDEPSLGLSPIAVAQVYEALGELKSAGLTMVLVEQSLEWTTSLAERVCVLELGRLRLTIDAQGAKEDPRISALYLGSVNG